MNSTHSELKKRIFTGILGGALVLAILFFGETIGVTVLGFIISLGMLQEFIGITFQLHDKKEKKLLLFGLLWLIVFTNYWIPRIEYVLLLFYFFILFGYFLFTADDHESEQSLKIHFQELMISLFGGLYLCFIPMYLVLIRTSPNGKKWIIFFFLLNWLSDTAAYFIGKKYGKRRLWPKISPKKTIEGALAGLGSGIVLAIFYKFIFFRDMSYFSVFFTPLLVGTLAQMGDLCESFFKRAYQRKDSGEILPGHGGFLDRFDGVIFSAPLMYACIRLFS
ncbi:MAG: phosphatidate cytidylyltransferase [Bdellovibrio sp.]|nr:phosphatidate cytidylyltransferase [Bdellovibrio sp.]